MMGIIPAAGKGKRMRPYTSAVPKELLLVGDKPIIEHIIEGLKIAGIKDIVVVISKGKYSIIDYLGSGESLDVNITYTIQDKQEGLAKAIECTKHLINDTFVVVNGDNFFRPKNAIKELISFHFHHKADATIAAFKAEDVTRHGIMKINGIRVIDIVEKPKPENAPSNLGDAGIHVFEPVIFDAIERIKPGVENEYQLTDAIRMLISMKKKVIFKEIESHIDVGTFRDWLKANYLINACKNTSN